MQFTYLLIILILLVPSLSYSKNLGTVGAVYEIKERDAVSELEERAKKIDLKKHMNKDKLETMLRNKKPEGLSHIKRVKKEKTYTFNPSYVLEFDIKDNNGSMLYPKGYTFNPLDYMKYPGTLVFIDGTSKAQIAWFLSTGLSKDSTVKLLLTDGSPYDLTKELKRPVFLATTAIAERVGLNAVPAVISQEGNAFKVREIYVKNK